MKTQISIVTLIAASLLMTACAKKEEASSTDSASGPIATESVSAEQQAAIDAIDQPVLDENNTDIPAEISNAPADAATADDAAAASSATVQS